ncbi:unnamed protein product [Pieris brassicae]|uniref:L antigen family member 3 n=1 Tax=Pieris brassicae TaxID=7116 RepID=A0A9P0TCG5_PIEBR|nr:unnamed protein product [Pieris brassicae]
MSKVSLNIPFSTNDHARIAYDVINVDKELKNVFRSLAVEDSNLIIHFEGDDYKILRLSVNGLLQNLSLVTKTISLFSL